MKKLVWVLLITMGCSCDLGCFAPQDAVADKAFMTAVSDMKTMAAQDEKGERDALRTAEARGLAAIEAKRNEVGKSLDGGLLTWQNAEKVNAAFGQVRADFTAAVAALDDAITVKYSQRNTPIAVAEAFYEYEKARRNVLEYGMQGFVEGMGRDLPALGGSLAGALDKLKTAGMPTSVGQLQEWLAQRVSGCAAGGCGVK